MWVISHVPKLSICLLSSSGTDIARFSYSHIPPRKCERAEKLSLRLKAFFSHVSKTLAFNNNLSGLNERHDNTMKFILVLFFIYVAAS